MFKKTIIVLLLALTPLAQARAVFVCSMMSARPLDRCCCEHAERAPAPREEGSAPCCIVTFDLTRDRSAVAASLAPASDRTLVERSTGTSPEVAIAAHAPVEPEIAADTLPVRGSWESFVRSGSRLYLLTARLRL